MTPNQIVGILAEQVGKPLDVPFQEMAKKLISTIWLKFLKDTLTKRPQDRKYYLQSFVAPVKKISKIECPINYGCGLRTTDLIPQPIRANGVLFDFVGSADLVLPYGQGGDWKERFFIENKYTSRSIRYTYRDNYIFIFDRENAIEYIGIIGLFENPFAIKAFKCLSADGLCGVDDMDYPMPGDLVEPLIKEALSILLESHNIDTTEVKVNNERGD